MLSLCIVFLLLVCLEITVCYLKNRQSDGTVSSNNPIAVVVCSLDVPVTPDVLVEEFQLHDRIVAGVTIRSHEQSGNRNLDFLVQPLLGHPEELVATTRPEHDLVSEIVVLVSHD